MLSSGHPTPPPPPPPPSPPPPSPPNGASSSTRTVCAACKHQRKKCTDSCMFAPYFPSQFAKEFLAAQKVFGVSNMAKLMARVPVNLRHRFIRSIIWEAEEREQNPIDGCAAEYNRLRHENEELRQRLRQMSNWHGNRFGSYYRNSDCNFVLGPNEDLHNNGAGHGTLRNGVVVPLNRGDVLHNGRQGVQGELVYNGGQGVGMLPQNRGQGPYNGGQGGERRVGEALPNGDHERGRRLAENDALYQTEYRQQ